MKKSGNSKVPVTVVVTVLNEAGTIEDLLAALQQQRRPPTQVIIVDGGSDDQTLPLLRQHQRHQPSFPLRIMTTKGNRSVGRNVGITAAKTELIAITDAGCQPDPGWLAELLKTYHQTAAPLIAGYQLSQTSTLFESAAAPYFLVMPDKVNPQDFLPATRSMLVTKTAWQAVGKFDTRLDFNEDYAFARRFRRQFPNQPIPLAIKATVTWRPRSTWFSFASALAAYAKGDVIAGLWRPKVGLIFARYVVAIALLIGLLRYQPSLVWPTLLLGLVFYASWAVYKNHRSVPPFAWFWLPILQITADIYVMGGSVMGLGQRLASKR